MRLARSVWSTDAKIPEAAVGADVFEDCPAPHTGRHASVSPKAPFQRAIKQASRGAYRCEAADAEQSPTATAAAVASCRKDEFLEGVAHEEAERAQSTQR